MRGTDTTTGKILSGVEHLRQSIADILTTPIGSRLRRRDYGSLLPFLVDQPQNPLTRIKIFGATAIALLRWEPRIRLTRVKLDFNPGGGAVLELEAEDLESPNPNTFLRLTVPLRSGAGGLQLA
jgi:hypothetical protein